MSTVKSALAQKSGALIHVRSGDMVVEELKQIRPQIDSLFGVTMQKQGISNLISVNLN